MAAMGLGNAGQPGAQAAVVPVRDAPGLDAEQEMPSALAVLRPSEPVSGRRELERPRRLERESEALLELRPEPVEAAVGYGVLESRVLAFRAVAEVALGRDHGLRDREKLLRAQESDQVREPRIGLRVAVRGTEAATDGQIEPGEPSVLRDRNEAEILGENVNVIDRRHGDGGLELTRQVGRAKDPLFLLLGRDLFPVEPDLVVGARARKQVLGEPDGPALRLGMRR